MKALKWVMMAGCFFGVFQSVEARAGNVYGNSYIVFDLANNKVKGISKTMLDYETAAYYTAYVCGELYKDGVSQVRACQGGLITATINTQFTGIAPGSVVSDHYVDMQYFDEEYQSYIDYEGYQFTSPGSYPIDWYFLPADIFAHFPVSIYLGNTYDQIKRPHISSISPLHGLQGGEYNVTITGTDFAAPVHASVAGTGITVSDEQRVSSTEFLAAFTVADNATGGSHAVTVTANTLTSDNSVDFYIQIPTLVTQDSIADVTTCDPTLCTIDNQPNKCGAYRTLTYQVWDQNNPKQKIEEDGEVTELISEWADATETTVFTKAADVNANGIFADLVGVTGLTGSSCPSNGNLMDRRQKFSAKFNNVSHDLTTKRRLQISKASGQYTITISTTTP
jgi:IPT/TIG domain-containing protein